MGGVANTIQVRFHGGFLDGRMLWVDEECASLNVQVAERDDGTRRTLEYRRDGALMVFVREIEPRLDASERQPRAVGARPRPGQRRPG